MIKFLLIALIVLVNVGALYGAYKAIIQGNYFSNAPFGAILILLGLIALIYGSLYLLKSVQTLKIK